MAFAVQAAVAAPQGRGVRSSDLKGKTFNWTDIKIVHEFDNESQYKGHAVAYVDHPDDLAALGKTMGHCAGTHFVWVCEERIWAFFTVITTLDLQPHTTLHAKELKWVGKPHPRDTAEFPYVQGYCRNCRGNGCPGCKYSGWARAEEGGDKVPKPRSSSGGYPTYADVCAAFESVGRKYEAGKYAPLQFTSTTYEISKSYKEPINNFDRTYGYNIIRQRPAGVDDETWVTYEKSVAVMKAQYDKGNGAVQIVGRNFNFDGKKWLALSFSGKGDYSGMSNQNYRGMMHEFFVESSRKKV